MRYAHRVRYEDKRTTITHPAELLELLEKLRRAHVLPQGMGFHRDNALIIWLAMQAARALLRRKRVRAD